MSTLWVLYKVDIILPQQQMNGMMDKKEGRVEKKKNKTCAAEAMAQGTGTVMQNYVHLFLVLCSEKNVDWAKQNNK